jgi:hypothetical protein
MWNLLFVIRFSIYGQMLFCKYHILLSLIYYSPTKINSEAYLCCKSKRTIWAWMSLEAMSFLNLLHDFNPIKFESNHLENEETKVSEAQAKMKALKLSENSNDNGNNDKKRLIYLLMLDKKMMKISMLTIVMN